MEMSRQRLAVVAVVVFVLLLLLAGGNRSDVPQIDTLVASPSSPPSRATYPPFLPSAPAFSIAAAACATIDLIVLTYSRHASLLRLLKSLERADYVSDRPSVTIIIDYPKPSATNETLLAWKRTIEVAEAWQWPHGTKQVIKRTENHGLARQWLKCWAPKSDNEAALLLEDDLDLSPMYYRWLKAARASYIGMPDLAGFTLQTQYLINSPHPNGRVPKGTGGPYLNLLPGSWGFAPTAKTWRGFIAWHTKMTTTNPKFIPLIPGLRSSDFYTSAIRTNSTDSIWTQWYIYYADANKIYTMYPNVPMIKDVPYGIANHWREAGEHYSEKQAAQYRKHPGLLAVNWSHVSYMPATVQRFNWSMIPMEPAHVPEGTKQDPCFMSGKEM